MMRSSSSSTAALLGSSSDLEIPSENEADKLAYKWFLKVNKNVTLVSKISILFDILILFSLG